MKLYDIAIAKKLGGGGGGGGGGLNVQAIGVKSVRFTDDLTQFPNYSITVGKTGLYTIYYGACTKSSYKCGTQVFINGAAYNKENTSFDVNAGQAITFTSVPLNQGDTVALYGKSFGSVQADGVAALCLIIQEEPQE